MIGHVDRIGMSSIEGWAHAKGGEAPTVEALFRGQVIGRAEASLPRPDVAELTGGDTNCGFVIAIDPPYDVDEIDVVANDEVLPKVPCHRDGDMAGVAGSIYQVLTAPIRAPLRLTTPRTTPHDIDICKRLISTYRPLFNRHDEHYAGDNSMWRWLLDSNFRHLTDIVARGDAAELCLYLLSLHKRPETWGIAQGPESYYLLSTADPGSAAHRTHVALYYSELLSLGEYLGVLPVENLGQGRVHGDVDLAALMQAIGAKAGIDPVYPHMAGGLFCLDTGAGLVQQRDVWALYTALRIADLLRDRPTRRVCEIGGGLGQVCHYARLLGVDRYVLIDLPHVSLLQAFQLLRSSPEARIALWDGDHFDTEAEIAIYPTFMVSRAPEGYFDLTVNVDSMPEMGWDNALAYARSAARSSAAFLSINQEARAPLGVGDQRQISVAELFAELPVFRQLYRFRSWVRRGYVESLFAVDADRVAGLVAKPAPQETAAPAVRLHGHLDAVGPEMIVGWARNVDDGNPVEVEILIDGAPYVSARADLFSAALKKQSIGSGRHAFAQRIPIALFDGQIHDIDVRVAGADRSLAGSPKRVSLPSIYPLIPVVAGALAADPWVIDAATLEGDTLTLWGWAIPPEEGSREATFLINGKDFDSVRWLMPRHDIHQLYFFHPQAAQTGFELSADIAALRAAGAEELLLQYARAADLTPFTPDHDYHFPLAQRSTVPLPARFRRRRVTGSEDPLLFKLGGYTLMRKIERLLAERYGAGLADFGRILDWGCGCGRLLRFLAERLPEQGRVFGADIDAENAAWCTLNLPSVASTAIALLPPTPFEAGQFDLIIGNSVFTHLAEDTQFAWLEELRRISAPGGLVLVSIQTVTDLSRETFHPEAFERLLREGFRSEMVDDALAAVLPEQGYYRSAFHTHDYIRTRWSDYFSIEHIIPQFSNNMQDFVIMRSCK